MKGRPLTEELRQVTEAARWLDEDDRAVFALWRREITGEIDRADVGAGAVQRMRTRLDRCRSLVAALDAEPRCPVLGHTVSLWDGEPSAEWRGRIEPHVRDCRTCLNRLRGETPVDRVLARDKPATVRAAAVAPVPPAAPAPRRGIRLSEALVSVAVVLVVVAGGLTAYTQMPKRSQPVAKPVAVSPSVTTAASPSPSCGAGLRALSADEVRDGATCLVWQRRVDPATYTFAGARTYCAELGGGWRVPTRTELAGIVTVSGPVPTIDRKAFPSTPEAAFWTSTKVTATQAWAIDFATGEAAGDTARSSRIRVRCVRK